MEDSPQASQEEVTPSTTKPDSNVLIYVLRRDLRVADNRILHEISTHPTKHGFTHMLPLYVFAANQVEIAGFVSPTSGVKSPYTEAISEIGGFWRCGAPRAKFILESIQDMKKSLESLGSGLAIRVGMVPDVVENALLGLEEQGYHVGAIWAFEEDGDEEGHDQNVMKDMCERRQVDFRVWPDEKHFVDEYVPPPFLPSRPLDMH